MTIIKKSNIIENGFVELSVEKTADSIIMTINNSNGKIGVIDIMEHEAVFYSDLRFVSLSDGFLYIIDDAENKLYSVNGYFYNKIDRLIEEGKATFKKVNDIEYLKEAFEEDE